MKHRKLQYFVIFALMALMLIPTVVQAMTEQEEITLGRNAVAELRQSGFSSEAPLTQVGSELKQFAERKELPWQFWVLEDTKQLNAFALPGGFVFITRLYYERLSVDELAFVVGHEMTHIEKRHFEQTMKRAKEAQLYDILAGVIIGATNAGRGWSTAADLGTTAYYTKYSRKLEKEADLGGYTLITAAGFDAQGAVTALGKLGHDKSDPITANIFATHPILSNREDRLSAMEQSSDIEPRPHPIIEKTIDPEWKYKYPPKSDLYQRKGLAARIEDAQGKLWDNKWRGDFRKILFAKVEMAGTFDIRAESQADKAEAPSLKYLKDDTNTDWLLLVTVNQLSSERVELQGRAGWDVRATVKLSAKMTNTMTGEEKDLGDFDKVLEEREFLPLNEETLYPDMPLTKAVTEACQEIAAKASSEGNDESVTE